MGRSVGRAVGRSGVWVVGWLVVVLGLLLWGSLIARSFVRLCVSLAGWLVGWLVGLVCLVRRLIIESRRSPAQQQRIAQSINQRRVAKETQLQAGMERGGLGIVSRH